MVSRTQKIFFAGFGVLIIIIATLFFTCSRGVVASIRLADGSEYMITQDGCDWQPEPYTISFYLRPAGGKWGWCYIDHQADRWRDVAMTYDVTSDVVTVTKRGVWQASLDRKRSIFAIGDGKPKRELAAPQDYREPEFPFP